MSRGTTERHARATRRRAFCESYGCEPVMGRACSRCGSATVLASCPDCGDAMVVCDCDDLGAAFDRFVSADGRCARCRPRRGESEGDGLGPARRSRSGRERHEAGKGRAP